MLKRIFDVALSASALLVLSPLFIAMMIWVKLDSEGPIFYLGERIGRYGKPFKMFKFRTMAVDADKHKPASGGYSVAIDDPRITKAGKFLRNSGVNELLQLINILKGDMSFVGPRPEVKHYVDMFTQEEKIILDAKPGLTDWATLWDNNEGEVLKGSADPEKTYMEKIRPTKLRLQIEYAKHNNFWIDLKILFLTFKVFILDRIFGGGSGDSEILKKPPIPL